jgi:hypothetical protein
MARRVVAVSLGSVLGCSVIFSSKGAAASPDCLYSEPSADVASADCSNDPLRLADQAFISSVIGQLGLAGAQINFVGCRQTTFATAMTSQHVYRITYPSALSISLSSYLAPITHELGHVFQIEGAGSIHAVRERLNNSSERIELGADFLAGIEYRRNMSVENRGEFERNFQLLGNYGSGGHGSPEDRIAAFRKGFYYTLGVGGIVAASNDFQFNGYGEIMAGGQ